MTVATAIPFAAGAATAVADGLADFDELTEGFLDYTVESGGITFWNSRVFLNEPPAIFVAEDASEYIPAIPDLVDHYSPPNVFQTSGFITGGSYLITRWAEISMTTGQIETSARMDVFYVDDPEFAGTEIVLEARLRGELVAEVAHVINNPRRDIRATSLEITDVEFDRLRIFGRDLDTPQLSGFLGSLDNVAISGGGPGSGLRLNLPEPGNPGAPSTISAEWGAPGARVFFAYGRQIGSTPVPGCPGLDAFVERGAVLGSDVTDANGIASVEFNVPPAAQGKNVYFQAFIPAECVASNYRPFTFAPD